MKSSGGVGSPVRIRLILLLFILPLPTLFCSEESGVIINPSPTPVPQQTFREVFTVKEGHPQAVPSVDYHPEHGCQFLGVGGRVIDRTGTPVKNLEIFLSGTLNDNVVQMRSVSGSAPIYGQGGFEFILAGEPIATNNTLVVMLIDSNGTPLSTPVTISTYNDCERNLILVDFWQTEGDSAYVKAACTATMGALQTQAAGTQTQEFSETLTATVTPPESYEP